MASFMPAKEKKLVEVKLPTWILMWDFIPQSTAGTFLRVYYQNSKKYINIWEGNTVGLTMVLAAYLLLSYWVSYKELKHE